MTELIIKNSILLTAGMLNLVMSIFIISRGWRNKVNLTFSLLTFSAFLGLWDPFCQDQSLI